MGFFISIALIVAGYSTHFISMTTFELFSLLGASPLLHPALEITKSEYSLIFI